MPQNDSGFAKKFSPLISLSRKKEMLSYIIITLIFSKRMNSFGEIKSYSSLFCSFFLSFFHDYRSGKNGKFPSHEAWNIPVFTSISIFNTYICVLEQKDVFNAFSSHVWMFNSLLLN